MSLIQDMANATLTLAVQRDGRVTVVKNRRGAATEEAALEELARLLSPYHREILLAALGAPAASETVQPGPGGDHAARHQAAHRPGP